MPKKVLNKIKHEFSNEVVGNEKVIVLSGDIGKSSWYSDAIGTKSLRQVLDDCTESTIRIKLNSNGGSVFEGIDMFNYLVDLRNSGKKVIVEVTSIAASAASVFAMGADEVIMRTGSTMMIHRASTVEYGNVDDFQKIINALETCDASINDIYAAKTSKPTEEIVELLKAETWMTAQEAVDEGFADSVSTKKEHEETEEDESKKREKQNKILAMRNALKREEILASL